MACVHDSAFAFCRMSGQDRKRTYYLLAFANGQVIPLKFVRLNPETLEPVDAP